MIAPQQLDALDPQQMRQALLSLMAEVTAKRSARCLADAERTVEGLGARARSHDPAHALRRGWTITSTADGRPVRSLADVIVGTEVRTRLVDGTFSAVVTATNPVANTAPSGAHPSTVELPNEEPTDD